MGRVNRVRKYFLLPASLMACLCVPAFASESFFYRYTNADGVKVLNHTIPPEYTQNGYEIISNTGQVIKVVPPAPSEGEVAKEHQEKELREKFMVLKRRYKSLDDLESAKRRRQQNLNTNISILRGNISSIQTRIENLMRQAAETERTGKNVTPRLLQKLTDTRAELSVVESALQKRLEEYQAVTDRFEQDIATFIKGSELAETESLN